MLELFRTIDTGDAGQIAATLEKDTTNTRGEALIEVYKKLRPGDPPTGDNAEKLVEIAVLQLPPLRPRPGRPLQAQQEARPGRRAHGHRAAARPSGPSPQEDIAAIVGHLIELNNGLGPAG